MKKILVTTLLTLLILLCGFSISSSLSTLVYDSYSSYINIVTLVNTNKTSQLGQVAASLSNGLVAHYTFDEGSGTTAGDSAGSYTSTLQNGVTWVPGKKGTAVQFSGDTMAVAASSDPLPAGAATVSAWIYPTDFPYLGIIVSDSSSGFAFRIADSLKRLQCTNGGGTTAYSASNSITLNVWQLVTAVRDTDGTCTLYINGVQSGSAHQNAGTIVAGSTFYIGRRPAAAYPFPGTIDDVRVYNRDLSADEIMQLFTSDGGVPPPVLYSLDVTAAGSGTVASNPNGISCGTTCSKTYTSGTDITLTATAAPGSTFTGWSGGSCSGTATCTISLEGDTHITATFTADNPPTVSGTNVTAKSCSQIDVQAAIDVAQEGDVVHVPAGNCSWTPLASSGGSVLLRKSLTLKGAGINQTNITLTNAPGYNQSALSVSVADKPFRVTGFTFNGDGLNAYISVGGTSKNFRIDHVSNKIDTPHPTRLIAVAGYTYGVIDHVETHSNGSSGGSGMILIRGEDNAAKLTGNPAWSRPLTLGSANAVFIEDSTFTGLASSFTAFNLDIENGGRVVFRHNTMTNVELGSHGAQSSGGRGAFSWEIYNNSFNLNTKVYSVMTWLRGGTGVIFNNTYTRTNGGYGYYIAFDNPRSHTAYGTFGSICNGTNPWDGNQDSTGYPCADQIGRSTGIPGHELLAPAYEWNNTVTGTGADVDVSVINSPSNVHIVEGRDFYSDACLSGYTPYPYPHPIVQAQDGVPAQATFLNCPGGPIVTPAPTPAPTITPTPTPTPTPLTTPVIDPPPTLGSVTTSALTTSVTLAFSTNEPTVTTISYGLTASLGNVSSPSTNSLNHSHTLTNLQSDTIYTYTIKAVDVSGNITTSAPKTFTTSKPSVTLPVVVTEPIVTVSPASPLPSYPSSSHTATTTPSRLPPTFRFTTQLNPYTTSLNVKNLQIFLNDHGFTLTTTGAGSEGNETTYYGPLTKQAVTRFQNYYKPEILTANRLTKATGQFGPASMKKANQLLAQDARGTQTLPVTQESIIQQLIRIIRGY